MDGSSIVSKDDEILIKWNFPHNGDGQIRGIADAGMEAFRGGRIRALAREICQNSLDAAISEDVCVRVEFELVDISSESIPGHKEVKEALNSADAYWGRQPSEDAKKFLRNAIKCVNSSLNIFVLRIGDYNTCGLSDPYNPHSMKGWNSLTRLDGGATKSGDQAGSFGIGKNAPFVNSKLHMVFYRTLNKNCERAAQGMMRLLSFPSNDNNGLMTTGFGYYGDATHNMPVKELPELERINTRSEVGTDVFIYGFNSNTDGNNSWGEEIELELISNFYMSIYRNKLAIKLRYPGKELVIDSASIHGRVQLYKQLDKNMYSTYRLLSNLNNVKEYNNEFHSLGILHLQLLTGSDIELNRKVLVIRKSGMKLFLRDRISRMVNFTGILELQGFELNKFFRDMENPEHNKWEPERHSDPIKARKYIKEIWDWVQHQVLSFSEENISDEVEVKGLEGILQNNDFDYVDDVKMIGKRSNNIKREGLNYKTPKIEIVEQSTEYKHKGMLHKKDGARKGNSTNEVEHSNGRITKNGKFGVTRTLVGTRKRTTREKHRGISDPEGKDILNKPVGGNSQAIPLQFVRIMKVDGDKYRLLFNSSENVKLGHIDLVTVGENGQNIALPVMQVYALNGVEKVSSWNGRIRFSHMWKDERVKMEFTIADNKEYAMEVHAYEDN